MVGNYDVSLQTIVDIQTHLSIYLPICTVYLLYVCMLHVVSDTVYNAFIVLSYWEPHLVNGRYPYCYV